MFDFHKNTSFNLKVRFFSFESLKPLCLFSNGGFSEINSTGQVGFHSSETGILLSFSSLVLLLFVGFLLVRFHETSMWNWLRYHMVSLFHKLYKVCILCFWLRHRDCLHMCSLLIVFIGCWEWFLFLFCFQRKNLDGAYIKDVVAESDPTAEPT